MGTFKLLLRQITGMVASPSSDGDRTILPELLRQIPEGEPIGTVTADGAHDTRRCHIAIMEREAVPFGHSFGPLMDGDGAPWLTPDCQTAEIHIRIAPMNRFSALGTAEIIRVARPRWGKGQSHLSP